jgi:hypothetical protein
VILAWPSMRVTGSMTMVRMTASSAKPHFGSQVRDATVQKLGENE